MQFSLKSLMLAVLFVALALVIPLNFVGLVELTVWCLLPCVLVALIRYGDSEQRTFASGSMTAYLALALQHDNVRRMNLVFRWAAVATILWLAGWLMLWLRRRLTGVDQTPIPPPPPLG